MNSLVLITVGTGAEVVPLASASACAACGSGCSPAAPSSAFPSTSSACRRRKIAAAAALADRLLLLPISAPSTSSRRSYICAPVRSLVSAHSSARGGGRGGTVRRAREATAIAAAQERRRRAACQTPITTTRPTTHLPLGGAAAFSSPLSSSSSSASASAAAACCYSSSYISFPSGLRCLSRDTWRPAEGVAVSRCAALTSISVRSPPPLGSRTGDTWQASRAADVTDCVRNRWEGNSGRRGGSGSGRRERRESERSVVMAIVAASEEADTVPIPADKPILFDVPVSNNGARVRLVLYIKELEDEVIIKAPAALGGLKSEAYLALNPLGKMPLLVFPDGTSIFESEVISEYFLDKYSDKGPSFVPHAIELRITSNLAKRILDMYIAGNMGAMYRAMDVESRAKAIAEINQYLDVLEDIITSTPYVAGPEISSGDTALFPNFVFMNYMLPQFFGWDSIFNRRPKLQSWWETMSALPAGSRVREEMETALNGWKESGRWDKVGINEHVKDTNYQWKF